MEGTEIKASTLFAYKGGDYDDAQHHTKSLCALDEIEYCTYKIEGKEFEIE